MAKTLIKLESLSFLILLSLHSQIAFSSTEDVEVLEKEDYEVDDGTPLPEYFELKSWFLASVAKQGACYSTKTYNIGNGVSANRGTGLLFCCKNKCANVLGDMNNYGQCRKKCKIGERCCTGVCTNIINNRNNYGKCNKKCKTRLPCENGFCGYA